MALSENWWSTRDAHQQRIQGNNCQINRWLHINHIANYLPYRSKVLENTKKKLLPETVTTSPSLTSQYSKQRCYYKFKQHVRTQLQFIQSSRLFDLPACNCGLFNSFTNKTANVQQTYDLLNFRTICHVDFFHKIAYYVLRKPSTHAPNILNKEINHKKMSRLDKDRRLVIAAMKEKTQLSKETGKPLQRPGKQLIEYPLALFNSDGTLCKGQKLCHSMTGTMQLHHR